MSDFVPPVSDDAVRKATGRDWAGWRVELDRWAQDLDHKTIARKLHEEYGLSGWWAQMVTGSWEMLTGRREKHERTEGFQATASKTVAAPAGLVEAAFLHDAVFAGWGPQGRLKVTSNRPGKTVNGLWEGDYRGGRIAVWLSEADGKTRITLSHEKLATAEICDALKAEWRAALGRLKSKLEGGE